MSDTELTGNVFLVTGDDEAMIEVEAAKLVRTLAGDDPDAFALDTVRAKEGDSAAETIRKVVRSVKSPPFMGGRKTVWLQGFAAFSAEGTLKSTTRDAKAFRELAEVIKAGIPEDIALILDGPGADLRKSLAKSCKTAGSLVVCERPKIEDRRNWEQTMRGLIEDRARDKGLQLNSYLAQALVNRIGTDTGRIEGELEKIICYIGGPQNEVTREAIDAVCSGQGEEISWTLSDALGRRDVEEALRVVDVLVRQTKDAGQTARSLLAQTAKYYRELLQAKLFMLQRKLRSPRSVMNELKSMSAAEKTALATDGMSCVEGHPFRCQMLAEQSASYEGPELIEAVRVLRDVSLKCITSSVSERVALEEALMRIAARPGPGPRQRRR